MTRKFVKRSIFRKKTKPSAARVVTAMQRKPRGRVWGDEEALADSGRTRTEQRKIHGRFGYLLMNHQCPSWKATSRLRPLCLEHCPRGKLPSLHSTLSCRTDQPCTVHPTWAEVGLSHPMNPNLHLFIAYSLDKWIHLFKGIPMKPLLCARY